MNVGAASVPPVVHLCDVKMGYALPRRYRDYVLRPLHRRRRFEALRGISLRIPTGQHLAVFGENGAGKTTLLKLISGLLLPTHGRVLVGEHDTVRHMREIRRQVACVINEERSFYWRLTGLENLRFFAALENLFGEPAHARMQELLVAVGLGAHGDRRVAEYSSGMRQRLALARGLLTSPSILLLDEPTRSLDPRGTDAIHHLLAGPLTGGKTMIIATNRFEDAAALCEQVIVIRDGGIAAASAVNGNGALAQVVGFVRNQLDSARSMSA